MSATGGGPSRAGATRAVLSAVLAAVLAACGSGTGPGELRLRVSGVLTSAVNGQPLRFGSVTLYELDSIAATRTPLAAVVASVNGSYVLTVNEAGCDETRLELEASAFGYADQVYDASSAQHVRCVADPQAIDFQLSPATVP